MAIAAASGSAARTWGWVTKNARDKLSRELSYPSIKQTADGQLHVACTYFQQAIKHATLPMPQA